MTWVKIDDGLPTHRKAKGVGLDGIGMFVAMLCYCAKHLTDGRIPKEDIAIVWPWNQPRALELADLMVNVGLMEDHGSAWVIRDYLDYQPSRADVEKARAANTLRQRKRRGCHAVTTTVTHGVSNDSPSRPVPSRPDPPAEDTHRDPKHHFLANEVKRFRHLSRFGDALDFTEPLMAVVTLNMTEEQLRKAVTQAAAEIPIDAHPAAALRTLRRFIERCTFVGFSGPVTAPSKAPYHATFADDDWEQAPPEALKAGALGVLDAINATTIDSEVDD